MAWPPYIPTIFSSLRNSYPHGSYSTVLNVLFPNLPCVPLPPRREGGPFNYIVQLHSGTPALYLQHKILRDNASIKTYVQADSQMRDHARELIDKLEVPRLHGISALGTRLAFYCYDAEKNSFEPNMVHRGALPAHWGVDVLSDEGYEKMIRVAEDVNDMAKPFNNPSVDC